jgi:hypothetical protein
VPPREPAPPPPVLSTEVSPEEEQRMRGDAQQRIDGTEELLRRIDQRTLIEDEQQNYSTIQSFLAKAREALSGRDVQLAYTLADKAYLLARDLLRGFR